MTAILSRGRWVKGAGCWLGPGQALNARGIPTNILMDSQHYTASCWLIYKSNPDRNNVPSVIGIRVGMFWHIHIFDVIESHENVIQYTLKLCTLISCTFGFLLAWYQAFYPYTSYKCDNTCGTYHYFMTESQTMANDAHFWFDDDDDDDDDDNQMKYFRNHQKMNSLTHIYQTRECRE